MPALLVGLRMRSEGGQVVMAVGKLSWEIDDQKESSFFAGLRISYEKDVYFCGVR